MPLSRCLKGFPISKECYCRQKLQVASRHLHNKPSGTQPDVCPWCQAQKDTRWHRLFEPFQHILDHYQELDPMIADLPTLRMEGQWNLIHALHEAIPHASVADSTVQVIHDQLGSIVPSFFTDGSCRHQDDPQTRFASWSIVVDLAGNDLPRLQT